METTTLTAPTDASGSPGGTGAEPNRLITILSPKGGAGKTTAATNLAVGLAQRYPRQVVLVDLDLQFGDVASNLRLSPKSTMVDLARGWPIDTAQLKLALTGHHSGLYTLCAPMNPAEADEVQSEHVVGVLRALQRSFKYVIVDTDPGLSERVLSALDLATDIAMVCSSERPSVLGLKKALEALDIVGLTSARRTFLMNRVDVKVGLDLDDVAQTIGQRIDVRVPHSIDMVLATNDGVPVIESGRNPAIVKAFEQLIDLYDTNAAAGPVDKGGLRLFKRKV